VDFVDQLPREDTGKIYKRLLRDQYRAAAAGQQR
jgi:acyl-coenzyme A synthetase/AMP-(fatty) acid ligase